MRCFLLGCTLAAAILAPAQVVRWTMLNITPNRDIADCHLIQLPSGANILIDAGMLHDAPGAAVAALHAQRVQRIDLAIVSHFHVDHYGALLAVVDSGIPIGRVAVNVPHEAAAKPEMPWGCNLEHVRYTLDELHRRQIPTFTPAIGEILWREQTHSGAPITLEVVSLFDGFNTPIGRTDVNDTSILVRLTVGPTRVLFSGDLNHAMGTYLAEGGCDLRADIIKVPHHGAESTVPNSFFDRVGASMALVSAPTTLWESDRAARIRNYFAEKQVPTFVSGLHGNVTVTLTGTGYEIETER